MDSFFTAFNTVFPIFVLMGVGYVLRKIELLDEPSLNKLNTLAFKVFLSVSLYYNIIKADIQEVFDGKLLLFAIISQLFIVAVGLVVAIMTEKINRRKGALSHGIFHTNFVIFGTLIGTSLCGEGKIGAISLLIATIVPLQNILSVIVLEHYRQNSSVQIKKMVMQVITNPYVIAAILGFATQLLRIHFPSVIEDIILSVGRCGTPIALLVMGGLFNFGAIHQNIRAIAIGCTTRLVLIPIILLPIAALFRFNRTGMIGLMSIFIAPSAVTSFNLACAMDSDADLASQLVVFTSLFSLGTIFGWIFVLSHMQII